MSQHPGRVTVTFHEPGMPPPEPPAPAIRSRARPAWPPRKATRTPVELTSQALGDWKRTWQLIVILLVLIAGTGTVVFVTAGALAGIGTAGGLTVLLAHLVGVAIRRRQNGKRPS
ncbi:hypothetical protein [Amycolatopsis jejuensis]|uniref:hypothetical protein n=1 Tax=Amycolatopsis jejuensis TaxID=330084 RepID=UPI0012E0187E|nr:hypothetical protein [Amycolatopsis jejuensis]